MAVTHITALRTPLATAARDAIDGGAGTGKLVFRLTGTVSAPGRMPLLSDRRMKE